MNQKISKIKTWIADHQFDLTVVAAVGTTVAAGAGLFYLAFKEEAAAAEQREKIMARLAEEFNAGRRVVTLENGTFLSIDKDNRAQILTW